MEHMELEAVRTPLFSIHQVNSRHHWYVQSWQFKPWNFQVTWMFIPVSNWFITYEPLHLKYPNATDRVIWLARVSTCYYPLSKQ
jgi:hypothetical protein